MTPAAVDSKEIGDIDLEVLVDIEQQWVDFGFHILL